jgi:hypothetical protein
LTPVDRFTEGAMRAKGALDGLLTEGALGTLETKRARGAEGALDVRGTERTLGTLATDR